MKKFNITTYVLAAICVVIFIPLGIAFLVSFNYINTDTSNDWIGFWGGYLGSIMGGLITLYVMHKSLLENRKDLEEQIKNEKLFFDKRYEYDKILIINQSMLKSCDDILERAMNFCTLVTKSVLYAQRYLENGLDDSQLNAIEYKNKLNAEFITLSTLLACREYERKNELYRILEELKRILEAFSVGQYDSLEKYPDKDSVKKSMEKQLINMKRLLDPVQEHLYQLNAELSIFYKVNISKFTS